MNLEKNDWLSAKLKYAPLLYYQSTDYKDAWSGSYLLAVVQRKITNIYFLYY